MTSEKRSTLSEGASAPGVSNAAPALHDDASPDSLDDPLALAGSTRWLTDAQGRAVAETALQLSGMYCAACAGTIEDALERVPGVHEARVLAATQRATVRWDDRTTRLSALIEAIRRAGYDAVPDAAAPARELRQREHRRLLWRLFVASFCAMQVMMLATPSYVAAPGDLADDLRALLNWGQWVLSLPVMGFAAGPFFRAAWAQLRARTVGMDVPVALALGVTFVASMGATFDPKGLFGHEVYFDSLTMFLSFLLAARFFEMRARHRAAEDLERALARMPERCERRTPDGRWERVSVQRLVRGDAVRVALGDAFPADGVLLEGRTLVDEALLTGESEPVPRAEGDEVVAASINRDAPVVMRVERVGRDTRHEAIVELMRQAFGERPATTRLADRVAKPFLWAVLLLAAGSAAVWSVIDPSRAIWVAVAVLVVTCPCALSLAAPAALVAAAGGLARRGVLFKRLDAIERMAAVDAVFFDKTGTLTEDRIEWRETVLLPGAALDAQQALSCAASLAQWSRHPLSRALVEAARAAAGAGADARAGAGADAGRVAVADAGAVAGSPSAAGPAAPHEWRAPAEQPGAGVQAQDAAGRVWRLGAWEWVGGAGTPPPDTRVALGCDGTVHAVFRFEEALRPDAVAAVAALRAQGVQLELLSGDRAASAAALGERAGIDAVVADATPEAKLAHVRQAQQGGRRVAMVGDGVNDAPVLAQADVSFAMGQGALVARTQADAVVGSGRLDGVVRAHSAARRTVRIIRQNLWWAAFYNAASVPLAAVGWLPPWAAGLGMALSSLLVVGNAQRAARV